MKTIAYLVLMGKEYPMIEYKDGWIALSKQGEYAKEFDWVREIGTDRIYQVKGTPSYWCEWENIIIAQSSNLTLEGVVKVEIEDEGDLKQEVLKFINHWELYFSSPKVGQPPSLQILKDVVNKAAQSKGRFTEDQVRTAYKAGVLRGLEYKSKGKKEKYETSNEDQLINTLLPRYEVDINNVPITYQKDGWTYYKLKG